MLKVQWNLTHKKIKMDINNLMMKNPPPSPDDDNHLPRPSPSIKMGKSGQITHAQSSNIQT